MVLCKLQVRGRPTNLDNSGASREKMSKQSLPAPTVSTVGPCSTNIRISKMPLHWKFNQYHRTTQPPPKITSEITKT